MMDRLRVERLTKSVFRPYGEVLERDGAEVRSINEGKTDRLHAIATIDVAAAGGRPIVSIFSGRRRPFPLAIAMLERHPLGSQCFFPLQGFDWLVVVGDPAAGNARPNLHCFRAKGDQGVSYRANVWHHPLLVLAPCQDFLVVDRDGPGSNCEEIVFPDEVAQIDIELPTC